VVTTYESVLNINFQIIPSNYSFVFLKITETLPKSLVPTDRLINSCFPQTKYARKNSKSHCVAAAGCLLIWNTNLYLQSLQLSTCCSACNLQTWHFITQCTSQLFGKSSWQNSNHSHFIYFCYDNETRLELYSTKCDHSNLRISPVCNKST
jgi:hypothetical protein